MNASTTHYLPYIHVSSFQVVEMAPALDLKPEVRNRMLEDAVKLCKAAKYVNAGTVEVRGPHVYTSLHRSNYLMSGGQEHSRSGSGAA